MVAKSSELRRMGRLAWSALYFFSNRWQYLHISRGLSLCSGVPHSRQRRSFFLGILFAIFNSDNLSFRLVVVSDYNSLWLFHNMIMAGVLTNLCFAHKCSLLF